MADDRPQRRLAAILAADVVGYSRLMEADEAGTLARLRAVRTELFAPATAAHGGRIFKTTGDGALVEFASAVGAVESAIEIQRALALRETDLPEDKRVRLRIGISLGDVIVEGADLYGNGVNVAARLEAMAEPGGICISGNTYESVGTSVDVAYEDLGEQKVKNIERPVRAYRVRLDEAEAPDAAELAAETAAILKRPAVAVLPFQNMSGDPEQEYFADGLTEDIITALTAWRQFPVIGRNSTFTFKGRPVRTQEAASELGARYVLEGSVRKSGNRVRVTAQLLDAETDHHLWAERYDRELVDIFDLQDEITRQIAGAMMPELERVEHSRSAAKPTESLDAWDCYLRGLALLNELDPEKIPVARALFERAVALDPGYAKAHARIALTYHRELYLGRVEDREDASRRMLAAAQRAVELDDGDSMSHWVLSTAYFWPPQLDGDISVRAAERAFALNPADIDANFTCGSSRMRAGRWEEALPHIEAALQISPRDPRRTMFESTLAIGHLAMRRPEEAARWAREALRESRLPDYLRLRAICVLLSALGHLGETDFSDGAVRSFMADPSGALRHDPDFLWYFHDLDSAEARYYVDGLRKAGVPEDVLVEQAGPLPPPE